jgi:hypothetical protein
MAVVNSIGTIYPPLLPIAVSERVFWQVIKNPLSLLKLGFNSLKKIVSLAITWIQLRFKYPITTAIVLTYFLIAVKRQPWRAWFSHCVHRMKKQPILSPDIVRHEFNTVSLNVPKAPTNHTHPIAAANRAGATHFMELLGSSLGLSTYYVQRSRADEKYNREGSRDYHWSKDIAVHPAVFKPPPRSLLCLVDVDQYLDIPDFLANNPRPTIIYTFQPSMVSRVSDNYSFTFDAQNTVHYSVTGGGRFSHKVWNYSTDHLIVESRCYSMLTQITTFLVDRRSTAMDHELIMLTPTGTWSGLRAHLARRILSGRNLKYLDIAQPSGFLRMETHSSDGVSISTGKVMTYLSTKIPAIVDEAIATVARCSKYDLTLPQVQSMIDKDAPKEAAMPLLEYHRLCVGEKPDVVCPVPRAVRQYTFKPDQYSPGAKPTVHAFMQPMYHGAFAPSRNKPNEEECIRARITAVRPKPLDVTPFLLGCIREFAERLIPYPGIHHPTDHEEVLDRQNRPSQRRLFFNSIAARPKRYISMFIKGECYPDIKPPRPISIINPTDKREYSRFIYAFERVLKNQPWYAFSKTPRRIASRITEILKQAAFATPTDFSKFDGHGSNVMRLFERALLMRAFHAKYHETLADLHSAQFGLKAYGMFGSWYNTEFARSSGSPETSVFNSSFNAFVAYLAMRFAKKTPDEAYASLGIYGGDDGISVDIEPEIYKSAAKAVGQEITIEKIPRDCAGIKFLARVYSPYVWAGDENNCCDIPRQLAKLHVTVNLPSNVTHTEKLLEKVLSFSLSDSATPIIGDFCKSVIHFSGELKQSTKTESMRSWLAKFDMDKQYVNRPAEWMRDYCCQVLPNFDYKRFTKWLSKATSVEYHLKPPMFCAPPTPSTKEPVVIEDYTLLPDKLPEVIETKVPSRSLIHSLDSKYPSAAAIAKQEAETSEQAAKRIQDGFNEMLSLYSTKFIAEVPRRRAKSLPPRRGKGANIA